MAKTMTKAEAAKMVADGLGTETFHDSVLGMFDVSQMRMEASMGLYGEPLLARLDEDMYRWLMKNREIDEERVGAVMLLPSVMNDPALGVFNDRTNETTFVDGSHRIAARWRIGQKNFLHFRVPLLQAPRVDKRFFIERPWGVMDVADGVGLVKRS